MYIAPPDPAILTDEYSGDENKGGDIDHLSKRQLLADAEVRTAGGITLAEDNPTKQSEMNKNDVYSTNNITPAYEFPIQKFMTPRIRFQNAH